MTGTTYTTLELRKILSRKENVWYDRLYRFDVRLVHWLGRHSLTLLRFAAGMVFLWIGTSKLVPGASVTEPLIRASFADAPLNLIMPALAAWEIAIGVLFMVGYFKRALLALLLIHTVGTFAMIGLRADLVFRAFPFSLSLEGQYLITNLMTFIAGLVVAATARGGGLTTEADALMTARNIEGKVELY
jgi:hypothetical protein